MAASSLATNACSTPELLLFTDEVILLMLDPLSLRDLIRVAQTCRRLFRIVQDSSLWRKSKLDIRFPLLQSPNPNTSTHRNRAFEQLYVRITPQDAQHPLACFKNYITALRQAVTYEQANPRRPSMYNWNPPPSSLSLLQSLGFS